MLASSATEPASVIQMKEIVPFNRLISMRRPIEPTDAREPRHRCIPASLMVNCITHKQFYRASARVVAGRKNADDVRAEKTPFSAPLRLVIRERRQPTMAFSRRGASIGSAQC